MWSPVTKLGFLAHVTHGAPERGGFDRGSVYATEHEVDAERQIEPALAGSQPVGVLTGSVGAKCVRGDRREVDDAAAAVRLRVGQDEAAVRHAFEAAPYRK